MGRMRHGWEGARGTDLRAASQNLSQPAYPHNSIIDRETASSIVLTGIGQYRSKPTRPKCDWEQLREVVN